MDPAPFAPGEVQAQIPEPIQLVFSDPPGDRSETPRRFSELPEDRATEPPESADLLSNVDSRARDDVPGETADAPRLDGRSDSPDVQLDPGAPAPPEPDTGKEIEAETTDPQPNEATQGDPQADTPEAARNDPLGGELIQPTPETPGEAREEGSEKDPQGVQDAAPAPTQASRSMQMLQRQGGTNASQLLQRPRGDFDLYQEAQNNPTGNAAHGDISLSTYAWDFAPWLQRFRRDFTESWYPPAAFFYGIIHGWNVVRIEVARDGSLLNMEVLEEEGDRALTQCSVGTFKAVAPYRPLPANFPDETLVLTVKLSYLPASRR